MILTSWRQASFQAFQPAYGLVIGTLREKPSYGENNHPEIVASPWKGQPRESVFESFSLFLSPFSPFILSFFFFFFFSNLRLCPRVESLAAPLHPLLTPYTLCPFASFSSLSLAVVLATTLRNYSESRERKRDGITF